MRSPLFVGLFTALLALHANASDEWPQFRGPDGQGHAQSAALPLTWSETQNVKWKCATPGEGWSSPVVSGSQIWMTTATEEGKSLRVVCVELASGKLLKDVEVFHVDTPSFKHATNSYASPSPIIEGDRLYVNFGTNGTACLSTADASVLWKREDLKLDHIHGPGSSPALSGDKLIIPCDGKDVRYVIALKKQTGETLWKTERPGKDGQPPRMPGAFCTPLVIALSPEISEAVIPGPDRAVAYDVNNGKELWSVDYDGFSEAARPVYGNGLVYFASGAFRTTLFAVRPQGSGNLTATGVVWQVKKDAPSMPSPVLVGNRLFAVNDNSGVACCLDALTGTDLWRQKIGGKFCASLLAAPGRIYFFDSNGVTTVVEAADSFKVLATNKLDAGCMASAAVAGNALLVRTKTHLYRIEQ